MTSPERLTRSPLPGYHLAMTAPRSALTRLGPVAADSAEPYLPPSERLIDGHPLQRAWVQFEDPAKGFYAGIWESDPGTWRIRYTEVEYCRILSGRSRITAADGTVMEVGPGDEFVIPSGFEGTWQVIERTRKTFVIHEAPP
jgi:uncharacterized cupin superfamily protein